MSSTGPLVNIDDAIARMPRYTRETVEAADELDEMLKSVYRPGILPFRIVWRWELDRLRDKAYHVLNRAVVTGTAWRIIAHHRNLDRE